MELIHLFLHFIKKNSIRTIFPHFLSQAIPLRYNRQDKETAIFQNNDNLHKLIPFSTQICSNLLCLLLVLWLIRANYIIL